MILWRVITNNLVEIWHNLNTSNRWNSSVHSSEKLKTCRENVPKVFHMLNFCTILSNFVCRLRASQIQNDCHVVHCHSFTSSMALLIDYLIYICTDISWIVIIFVIVECNFNDKKNIHFDLIKSIWNANKFMVHDFQ